MHLQSFGEHAPHLHAYDEPSMPSLPLAIILMLTVGVLALTGAASAVYLWRLFVGGA